MLLYDSLKRKINKRHYKKENDFQDKYYSMQSYYTDFFYVFIDLSLLIGETLLISSHHDL